MATLGRRWKALSPFTRRLVVFAAVNALVVDVALMVAFLTPWPLTALGHTADFLLARQGEDSWGPMGRAWEHVAGGGEGTVYDEIFFEERYKFQYPPTTLLAYAVLDPLSRFLRVPLARVLNALSWLSVALAVACAAWLHARASRESGLDPGGSAARSDRWVRLAAVVVLGLTFYPLVRAYTQGQIQAWINGAFALALAAHVAGRTRTSGALLAAATLIKPQYGLFLVWGCLRRRWGFVAAFVAVAAAGLALSVAAFGWESHAGYLDVLRFLGERGESYYANQSVNGLLHRLVFNGYNLGWKGRAFPPFHPVVYALTLATSVAFVAVGMLWRTAAHLRGGALDLCVIAVTCTLASPVAWEHHWGILFPILAWTAPAMWRSCPRWLVVAIYVVSSNFLAATAALAPIPVANLGQSYLLFGAGALWVLLIAERATRDSAGST